MDLKARTWIVTWTLAACFGAAYAGCTQDFDQFEPKASGTGGSATSTGGAGPSTGGSGASGGGANGGTGGMPECTGAGDCDDDNPCTTDTCTSGACSHEAVPDGPVGMDAPTDCVDTLCVGGMQSSMPDDTEVPDDSNECTTDACSGGQAMNMPVAEGTPCQAGFCNAAGQCAGCTNDAQCGQSDDCKTFDCDNNGTCQVDYAPQGTFLPVPQQTPDDCKSLVCDGNGNVVTVDNDNDEPDDNNDCTVDGCDGGNPTFDPEPAGTQCNGPGQADVCDGMGNCVECVDNDDCAPNEECVNNSCECVPATCQSLGKTCGTAQDGCGNTLNCNNGVKDGTETDVDCGGSTQGCNVDCTNGKICKVGGDCTSGNCVDGVCCNSTCQGVCRACNVAGSVGTCADVPALQEDPPGCTGNMSCDGNAACKLDNGQACSMPSDCASGSCVSSTCQ